MYTNCDSIDANLCGRQQIRLNPCSRGTKKEEGTRRCPLALMEATPRFELGVKALQASALPLGHVAVYEKGRFQTGLGMHGAGYGVRTRDLNLGKVARYQLR